MKLEAVEERGIKMVSEKIRQALAGSSAIRAMFREGKELAAEVGAENVYDFSLGNPATPAPDSLNQAIREILDETDPLTVHGYMDNSGYEDVRQAVAENLNRRFQTDFDAHNVIMTVGAAGGLNIIFKTILDAGSEVLAFVPYFGEYKSYAANFDAKLVEVAPDYETFWPDLEDFRSKISPATRAVIVNTPNNPTGVVYPAGIMEQIAAVLLEKEKEYGADIYLISDEPYRELVYDGAEEDFLTKYYHNTLVGYSFSKSLSLPGERIGYVVVPNEASDSELLIDGMNVSNRTLGFVNAPSLMQKAVARCLEEKTNIDFYDANRKLLYENLTKFGFFCIRPQGAFYLWMKSPLKDEEAFVRLAKKYNLILVKGGAFACPGYVRIAYCVSKDMLMRALPAFEKLAAECKLTPSDEAAHCL